MRRRLITSDTSTLEINDHVAWCGEGPGALDDLAVSTFSRAAQRGAQLHFVCDPPDLGRLTALEGLDGLVEAGSLHLSSIEDTYAAFPDPRAQLALFERMLDAALASGYSGICVVADNSPLVAGTEEAFSDWLAWEATADRFQARRPVTGVCFFDQRVVPPTRLADLASVHPVLSSAFEDPNFQVFADGDAVRVIGEVDRLCSDQLYRVLSSAPQDTELVLDFSDVDFIDHRGLMTLDRIASECRGLRVRSASPFVRRVWQLLDLQKPSLEFS